MMSGRMALKVAIDLLHVPSQVRLARAEPLPDDVLLLLRITSGEEEAARSAAAASGRSLDLVRRSAAFFVEQILFAPDSDSYRVLGTSPQAAAAEIRRNAALLMKWLHPDHDIGGTRLVFATKVTEAWNNLKTPERRAAYDAQRRVAAGRSARGKNSSSRRSKKRQVAAALARRRRQRDEELLYWNGKAGFFRRALSLLLQRPV
jgi:DnaJ-domain-containing protein 1